jgi:hypothetical protein
MAQLTGIFNADFTSFTKACEQAEVSLKGFETGAGKTAVAIDKIADSLSGQKIVQQAIMATTAIEQIGGAAMLTTDELLKMGGIAQQAVDKLTAIGETVPPQVQNLADRARGASEELLRLKDGADATGTAFSQWATKFDLKTAIENPIGTAKAGVLAFAETLGPTGVAIGGVVTVASLLGGELISLAHDADEVGLQIGKLSRQFNIPVEAMSDLRFAIVATGGDFGAFGDSLFMFQKRLEENSDAVSKGLEKIGLSLQTIQGLQGDQQILAISDAMRQNAASTNLSAVAFDLFGRQGREMLPTLLKPLSDLNAKSQELGDTWSTADVDASRAFRAEMNLMKAETEEAWNRVGQSASGFTHDMDLVYQSTKLGVAQLTDMAINALPAAGAWFGRLTGLVGDLDLKTESAAATQDVYNRLLDDAAKAGKSDADATEEAAKGLLSMGYSLKNVAEATGLSIDKIRELNGVVAAATTAANNYNAAWDRLTKLEQEGVPTLQGISQSTLDYALHLQDLHAKVTDITVATGLSAEQQKLLTKAHQDGQAAADKYAAAWTELNSTGKSYADTVALINPKIVEQAEYYLKAGNSIATVAAAFPQLSAAQAKALDEMVKAYDKAYKEIQKIEEGHVKQQETNIVGLSKAENDQTQGRIDAEKKAASQIEQLYAKQHDDAMKSSLDAASYQIAKIYEVADANVAAMQKSGATSQQIADFTRLTYAAADLAASQVEYKADEVLDHVTKKATDSIATVKAAVDQMETLQGGVKLPGSTTETAFGQNYLLSKSGARVPLGPHGELPKNWDDLYSGKSSFPQFAGGVQNFSGGLAIVGEKGPELVNLPAGSDVIPGGVGGTSVTNHIYVNGTAADVARQVAAEIMKSLKSTQQLTLR